MADRRIWRPEPGAGRLFGGALAAMAMLLQFLTIQQVVNSSGAVRVIWSLVALVVAGAAVYVVLLLVRMVTLRYVLDDEALVVSAFGQRIEVPYADITGVDFRPRDVIELDGYERYWPGYRDSISVTSDGPWRSVATTPPHERVRIRTGSGATVAISPERPVLFAEALDTARRGRAQRQPVTMTEVRDDDPPVPAGLPVAPLPQPAPPPARQPANVAQSTTPRRQFSIPRPLAYRIFRERIVRGDLIASRLLALCLLVLIVLVFMAAWKVDSVNSPLAVTWNADGEPTWFMRPDGIWIIDGVWIYPVTAGAVIAVNAALATLFMAMTRVVEARLVLAAAFVTACILLIGMVGTTGLI